MPKQSFTAPAWFLLGLGIFASCLSVYMLNVPFRPGSFFLPAISLIEACMYWMVRKRNIYRRASWSHVWLFTAAYSTPFVKNLLFEFYDNFTPTQNMEAYIRYVNVGQVCAFWGLMVLAHIFFVRLFMKIFSRQPAMQEGAAEPENLLDDVLE